MSGVALEQFKNYEKVGYGGFQVRDKANIETKLTKCFCFENTVRKGIL